MQVKNQPVFYFIFLICMNVTVVQYIEWIIIVKLYLSICHSIVRHEEEIAIVYQKYYHTSKAESLHKNTYKRLGTFVGRWCVFLVEVTWVLSCSDIGYLVLLEWVKMR